MLGREPVILIAALAAILQGIWIYATNDASAGAMPGTELLAPVITVLAGWWARRKVMPVATIKDAGLSPGKVKAQAENPTIEPYEGD